MTRIYKETWIEEFSYLEQKNIGPSDSIINALRSWDFSSLHVSSDEFIIYPQHRPLSDFCGIADSMYLAKASLLPHIVQNTVFSAELVFPSVSEPCVFSIPDRIDGVFQYDDTYAEFRARHSTILRQGYMGRFDVKLIGDLSIFGSSVAKRFFVTQKFVDDFRRHGGKGVNFELIWCVDPLYTPLPILGPNVHHPARIAHDVYTEPDENGHVFFVKEGTKCTVRHRYITQLDVFEVDLYPNGKWSAVRSMREFLDKDTPSPRVIEFLDPQFNLYYGR